MLATVTRDTALSVCIFPVSAASSSPVFQLLHNPTEHVELQILGPTEGPVTAGNSPIPTYLRPESGRQAHCLHFRDGIYSLHINSLISQCPRQGHNVEEDQVPTRIACVFADGELGLDLG